MPESKWRVSRLLQFRGHYESLENYEKAAAIYQRHIKSDQQRVAHVALYNLGHTYDLMQYAWQDLGNYFKAVECSEKALEIRKKIVEGNPKNVRGRSDLADTHFALGETLRKEGLAARAAADYRQSQAIAESEAASDPNDQRAKETLAFADYGLGESLLRQQGNLSQAIDLGQRAVKIASALVAADPLNAQSKTQLAVSYGLLGDAHRARGLGTRRGRQAQASELKEAVSLYQKGLEIFASLRQTGNLSYSQIPELSRVPREIAKCNAVMQKAQSPVASEIK